MYNKELYDKGLNMMYVGAEHYHDNRLVLASGYWDEAIKIFIECEKGCGDNFLINMIRGNLTHCLYYMVMVNIKLGNLTVARKFAKQALKVKDIRKEVRKGNYSTYQRVLTLDEYETFKKILEYSYKCNVKEKRSA